MIARERLVRWFIWRLGVIRVGPGRRVTEQSGDMGNTLRHTVELEEGSDAVAGDCTCASRIPHFLAESEVFVVEYESSQPSAARAGNSRMAAAPRSGRLTCSSITHRSRPVIGNPGARPATAASVRFTQSLFPSGMHKRILRAGGKDPTETQ